MKQKVIDSEIVTRQILKEELNTQREEIKKELKNYTTKKDLDKRFEISEKMMKLEIKLSIESWQAEIDKNARLYRDQILTKMDQVVGELTQIREDQSFEKYEHKQMQERITKHEHQVAH